MNEHGNKYKIHYNAPSRRTYDVFFARGHRFDSYPGNKLYRKEIRLYSRLYKQSSDLKEKKAFADNVIASIHSKMGRFFHQSKMDKNAYQELDPRGNELRDKVRQALRDTGEKTFDEEEEMVKVVVVAIDRRSNSTQQQLTGHGIERFLDMGSFRNGDHHKCHFGHVNHDFNNGNISNRTTQQDEGNKATPGITPYQKQHLNTNTAPNITTNTSITEEYSTKYLQFQHHNQHQQQYQCDYSQPSTRSNALPFMTVDVDKGGDVNRMQNPQQNNHIQTQQLLASDQSFTTANTKMCDCKEKHNNHQYKNTSNHPIPIKQISDDEDDLSEIVHQTEVSEIYNDGSLMHIQDAMNDRESNNQQHIISFLTSNMSNDIPQTSSQIVSSNNAPIVTPQCNKLRAGKQFQPIHDTMDENEQLGPQAEVELRSQPRHELRIEPISAMDQSDDYQLTNSELDEIINCPLFSPEPSFSSSYSDWSMSSIPDLGILTGDT